MMAACKSSKGARGEIGKSFKSRKEVSTKFNPPIHPAIVITSAFTAPHIDKLKKKLEENYIAYGMQTSKKKLNRPPGAPTDKTFLIVDDTQGSPVLQGQFLGLKMCRVDYPNKTNLDGVIKKFDSYIGLGKQSVEEEEFMEAGGYENWEQQEENERLLKLANQQQEMQNQVKGDLGIRRGALKNQIPFEEIEALSDYKSVFSTKKAKKQHKKDKDDKNGNISLKSVKQIRKGPQNRNMQKRVLFMLMTSQESSRYAQYVSQFQQSNNKRIIVIRSIDQYYRYFYEGLEGENCLLVSPNAALKELYKFRNLKNVYVYGEDQKLCAKLVKGNIKKAALTPGELDKILLEEGFDKNQSLQLVEPIRVGGAQGQSPAQSKLKAKSQQKPSLFDRFMGLIKGKSKPKEKDSGQSSDQDKDKRKRERSKYQNKDKEKAKLKEKQKQKQKQKDKEKEKEKEKERQRQRQRQRQKREKQKEKQKQKQKLKIRQQNPKLVNQKKNTETSSSDSDSWTSSEDSRDKKKKVGKVNSPATLQVKNQKQKQLISLGQIIDSKMAETLKIPIPQGNQNGKKQPQKRRMKKLKTQQGQGVKNSPQHELDMQYFKKQKIPPRLKSRRELEYNKKLSLPPQTKDQRQKQEQDKLLLKSALKKQEKNLQGNAQRHSCQVKFTISPPIASATTNNSKLESRKSQSSESSSENDLALVSPGHKKLKLNKNENQAILLAAGSGEKAPMQACGVGGFKIPDKAQKQEDEDAYYLGKPKKKEDARKEAYQNNLLSKNGEKLGLKANGGKKQNEKEDNFFVNRNQPPIFLSQGNTSDDDNYLIGIKNKKQKNAEKKDSKQAIKQNHDFNDPKKLKASYNFSKRKKNFPDLEPQFYFEMSQGDLDRNKYNNNKIDTPKVERGTFTQTYPSPNQKNNGEPHQQANDYLQGKVPQNLQASAPNFDRGLHQTNPPMNFQAPQQVASLGLQSKGSSLKPPFFRNNRAITATDPRNFKLPFDESNYDRFVENGVVIYRPKSPFSRTSPNQALTPRQPPTPSINLHPHQPPRPHSLTYNHTHSAPTNPNHVPNTTPTPHPNSTHPYPYQYPPHHFNLPNYSPNRPALRSFSQDQRQKKLTISSPKFAHPPRPYIQKRLEDQIKIPEMKTVAKSPSFSTYEYFMNKVQPQNPSNKLPDIGSTDQDFPYYLSQKPKHKHPQQRKLPHANKQNINLYPDGSALVKKSNLPTKRPKHKKFIDSLDSDSTDTKHDQDRLNFRSKSLGRYVDPLSQILENASPRAAEPNKNYSILYLVNSKLSPKIIKEIFQISDDSDTIQTYSHPDKLKDIIKKGENVFDYILVFPNNFGETNLLELDPVKGLYIIQYDAQKSTNLLNTSNSLNMPSSKNKKIVLRNTADLPSILVRNRLEIRDYPSDKPQKSLGSIYFKDFNQPIREMAKLLKKRYPNAQIRRYFGLMDLPTKLPREKNNLTIILLDEVGFNQVSAYCSSQEKQNENIVKICIPKSSEALKLCQKSATAENIIWLTQKEVENGEFILKCIQKRFQ